MREKKKLKVLILRFGALGDIVHTTIIAQAIKKQYPDYEVHYCVETRYSDILKNNSDIDKIYCYNQMKRKDWFYTINFAFELRKERYNVVFNLTNALRNNLMALIIAPEKIIYHEKSQFNHVVDDFFETAKRAFPDLNKPENLHLEVDKDILIKVNESLNSYPHPWLVVSPGGETDGNRQGRMWAKDSWIEFCKQFLKEFGGTVFINGSSNEKNYHEKILKFLNKTNTIMLTGKYSLAQSMCLTKLADLFISGDTGPLHLASALNVKTIGLFGSTDPQNVAPYGKNGYCVSAKNGCRFCWKKRCDKINDKTVITPCMSSILPKDVISIINKIRI